MLPVISRTDGRARDIDFCACVGGNEGACGRCWLEWARVRVRGRLKIGALLGI